MAHLTVPITLHVADLPEVRAALQQLADIRDWADQHREAGAISMPELLEILGMRPHNPGPPVEPTGRPAPVEQPVGDLNEWIADQQQAETRVIDRRCGQCGRPLTMAMPSCTAHLSAAAEYAVELQTEVERLRREFNRVAVPWRQRIAALAAGDFASAGRDFGRGVAHAVRVMRGEVDVDGHRPAAASQHDDPVGSIANPFPGRPASTADRVSLADRIRSASNG